MKQVWLLRGKQDEMYRSMWETAMDDMIAKMLYHSQEGTYTYITEITRCVLTMLRNMPTGWLPLTINTASGSAHGTRWTICRALCRACWRLAPTRGR